jgi:hypothetical protein
MVKILIKNGTEECWYRGFIGKQFIVTLQKHQAFGYTYYRLLDCEENATQLSVHDSSGLHKLMLRDEILGVSLDDADIVG